MRMNLFCISLFVVLFRLTAFPQSNEEQIVNNVINYESLIVHLSNQEIIDLSQIDFACSNEYIDTNWHLHFQGGKIEFNTEFHKTSKGFSNGYDLEILHFRKRKNKATIQLNLYPSFFPCPNDNSIGYTGQWHALHITIEADLIKEKRNWVIIRYSISDESFVKRKDKEPCIFGRYKRYGN